MTPPLPVRRAHDLDAQAPEHRWLIEELWATEAVGIVCGGPKCCKSFLALAVAVAVASGAPCLRRFRVARSGRVLLFAAEDALHVVRARLAGIARAAGVAFDTLDIQVITAPTVRLDLPEDQDRLRETVARLRPTLLVLDRSSASTASTRTRRPRSPQCSPTCARSSASFTPPSSSSTTPAKGRPTPGPARRCAALRAPRLGRFEPLSASPRRHALPGHRTSGRSLARRPRRRAPRAG